MSLYVFGDSFAHRHRGDFLWYNLLSEFLGEKLYNFGENGTGPVNLLTKFKNLPKNIDNSYFVILLSAPERLDYDFLPKGWTAPAYKHFSGENNAKIVEIVDAVLKDEYKLTNIKNVLFFKFISDYLKPNSKFFICTTFGFDEDYYAEYLKNVSNDKFFVSDLNLDLISQQEFIDFEVMDCDTDYNRFKYDDGTVKLISDKRPNHFSKQNHQIFCHLILNFFENGEHTYYRNNMFKSCHLDENSEFMTLNLDETGVQERYPHYIPGREFLYE